MHPLIARAASDVAPEAAPQVEKSKILRETDGREERAHHLELFLDLGAPDAPSPGTLARTSMERSRGFWLTFQGFTVLLGPGLILMTWLHAIYSAFSHAGALPLFSNYLEWCQILLLLWVLGVLPLAVLITAGASQDLLKRRREPGFRSVLRGLLPRLPRAAAALLAHGTVFLLGYRLLTSLIPWLESVWILAIGVAWAWSWLHVSLELVEPGLSWMVALGRGYAATAQSLRLPRKAFSDPLSRAMLGSLTRFLFQASATVVSAWIAYFILFEHRMTLILSLDTAPFLILTAIPVLMGSWILVHLMNRLVLEWSHFRLALQARQRSGPATVRRLRETAGATRTALTGSGRWRRLA